MSVSVTLQVGTQLVRDGSLWEVVEFSGSHLVLRGPEGRVTHVRLLALLAEPGLRQVTGSGQQSPEPAVDAELSNLTHRERERLTVRLGHVREVLTGFRRGEARFKAAGEPRPQFARDVPLMQRYASKAAETGVHIATVRRWVAAYQSQGPLGLRDQESAARPAADRVDPRWLTAARAELASRVAGSRPTRQMVLREIAKRVERMHGAGVVPVPGKTVGYAVLTELGRGTNAFSGSTKGKRSIANRPQGTYGRLVATRPGEYLLLDTNSLDVFAMDPRTLQWHGVELTVAMDLYSRAIVGLCVSPTTKSVDVAWVLREALDPASSVGDGALAYVGHPEKVVIDESLMVDAKGQRLLRSAPVRGGPVGPSLPSVAGEAIVVDHGKVYVSDHVYSVCERQGISVQPARPYTPTDKAPVERVFRTLKDDLLVALPGYKGADIGSRGASVEEDAYYFLDELEQIIREWIVEVYHRTPHDGLCVPEVPGLKMSPLDMLAHGVARAGHLQVPARQDWAFDWLKAEWRTIQHYGVEMFGLRYNGDALNPYRNKKSGHGGAHPGKWPIHHDPRDIRQVWFQDPEDHAWHALTWEHAGALGQPFGVDALRVARRLARETMRFPDDGLALERLLSRWESGRAATASERRKAVEYAGRHGLLHPTDDEKDDSVAATDGTGRVGANAGRGGVPSVTDLPSVRAHLAATADEPAGATAERPSEALADGADVVSDDDDESDLTAGAPDETDDDYYADALDLL